MRFIALAAALLVSLPAQAAQWCLIEDGQLVDGPRDLPSEWKGEARIQYTEPDKVDPKTGETIKGRDIDYVDTVTFTGLEKWSPDELAAKGWHRAEDEIPTFDPETERAVRGEAEFKNGRCVQHYTIEALPAPAKTELQILIEVLIAKGVVTAKDLEQAGSRDDEAGSVVTP